MLAALAITAAAGTASAAVLDFEGIASGTDIAGVDLGGAIITQGTHSIYVNSTDPSGNSSRTILGNTGVPTEYRADFTSFASMVSVDIGDYNSDADDLYLRAYDSSNSLLASDTLSNLPSFSDMATLSVIGSNISYVVFGGIGLDGNMNVYADNLNWEVAQSPSQQVAFCYSPRLAVLASRVVAKKPDTNQTKMNFRAEPKGAALFFAPPTLPKQEFQPHHK